MKAVFAAHHRGPRLCLEPVADLVGGRFLGPRADAARALRGAACAVRGLSKSPEPDTVETRLAAAARRSGVPLYAVEDYPGNFPRRARADGLFAEFPRPDLRGVPVYLTGNPRWAALPPRPGREVRRAWRRACGLGPGPAALWAGQPDPRREARTLEAVLPALARLGLRAVVRRHPNHPPAPLPPGTLDGSRGGALLAAASCDLVVTQFSSLGVEAGFLGTPAVFVLLPGSGRDYHREMTGVPDSPWCSAGFVGRAGSVRGLAGAFEEALRDGAAARRRRSLFAARARWSAGAAARVAAVLRMR